MINTLNVKAGLIIDEVLRHDASTVQLDPVMYGTVDSNGVVHDLEGT